MILSADCHFVAPAIEMSKRIDTTMVYVDISIAGCARFMSFLIQELAAALSMEGVQRKAKEREHESAMSISQLKLKERALFFNVI